MKEDYEEEYSDYEEEYSEYDEEYLDYESEIDLNSIKTDKNIPMYIGGTGCGKTFKAINESDSFVIAVPTRQLAYEIALDYKDKISKIDTGEVHLGDYNKNMVCVYENLSNKVIDRYDTLIIDEAHFLADESRGATLLSHIVYAINNNKNIIMMTATDTLPEKLKKALSIKNIELKPYKKVEKIELDSFEDMQKLLKEQQDLKVLVFTKYTPDEYDLEQYAKALDIPIENSALISANIPTAKRLETQLAFKKGELQLVVSTNVLAQGVNFPADMVVIEYNEWDEWEIVQQKIGRAGRPQFCDKAYYYLHSVPNKRKREVNATIHKQYRKRYRKIDISKGKFEDFEIPTNKCREYKDFKYSKRFFRYLKSNNIKLLPYEEKAYRKIYKEEYKVMEILKAHNFDTTLNINNKPKKHKGYKMADKNTQDNILAFQQNKYYEQIVAKLKAFDSTVTPILNFNKNITFGINFADPKGANIVFKGDYLKYDIFERNNIKDGIVSKTRNAPSTLHYKFENITDKESFKVEIKNIPNFNRAKVTTFSKETLALIPNAQLRELYGEYMNAIGEDEILVLQSGMVRALSVIPKDLKGYLGDLEFGQDEHNQEEITVSENKNNKKLSKKGDLKVYETPSKLFESYLKSMSIASWLNAVENDIAERLYKILSNKKNKQILQENGFNVSSETLLFELVGNTVSYMAYSMMKSYNSELNLKHYETNIDKSEIEEYQKLHSIIFEKIQGKAEEIFAFIEKVAKDGAKDGSYIKIAFKDKEKYKNTIGKNPIGSELVFFDPQMGSADGFFEAVEKCGLTDFIKMWGYDIREDIEIKDKNRRVVGGINTSIYSSTIEDTFNSKTYTTASESVLTWNNPPYSIDDGIAKDTLKLYAPMMHISGLYPLKMEKTLRNSLTADSIIVEIPREMTGYTDENTPEKFLFVYGYKKHPDSSIVFDNKFYVKEGEDLTKRLCDIFIANNFRLNAKVLKNIEYHKDKPFDEKKNILENHLNEEIIKAKEVMNNVSFFKEILTNNKIKELFYQAIQPTQLAKSEKVFVDNRYYSSSNDYKFYSFDEVITNPSLLIHYIKNSPKIFEILEEVAKEKKVSLPVDKKTVKAENFTIGEKFNGKKQKVTTENLGMVKYSFYPEEFNIKNENSKEKLIDIIKEIYKDNDRILSPEEIEAIEKTMSVSSKLAFRIENTISTNELTKEYESGNREVLVFVDEFGMAIDKLNISIYDLYTKLEEKEYLNIEDYIEVAKLNDDEKVQISKGFIDFLENVPIRHLAEFNNMSIEELEKELQTSYINLAKKLVAFRNENKDKLTDENKDKLKEGMTSLKVTAVREIIDKLKVYQFVENHFMPSLNFYDTLLNIGNQALQDILEEKEIIALIDMAEEIYNMRKELFFGKPFEEVSQKFIKEITKIKPEINTELLKSGMEEFTSNARLNMGELRKHNDTLAFSTKTYIETLLLIYPDMKRMYNQLGDKPTPEQIEKLYKKFKSWEYNIINLMEHQIEEPEAFINLNDTEDITSLFMLQKMRTGKTLKFIMTGFLKMIKDGDDMELLLESKNIKDIAYQLTSHFSILLPIISVFADDSKHQFKSERSFDMLYHTSISVNPIKSGLGKLNREILGGGDYIKKLKLDYSKTIEILEESLDEKYPEITKETLDEFIEQYKDSDFIDILIEAKNMCQG